MADSTMDGALSAGGSRAESGRPAETSSAADRGLRLMLAQLNFVVGDIAANSRRIIEVLDEARDAAVDIVVFPELAVCGYPPEDLLLRASFLRANEAALDDIAEHSSGLTAVVGFADRDGDLHNAAAVLHDGVCVNVVHKVHLPTYSVFDEARYFRPGEAISLFRRAGVSFGVSICEDIWVASGPPHQQARAGAQVLVNISASPYVRGKISDRERMLVTRAADDRAFVVFCNAIGGQDELVFDGSSLVIDPAGEILARGASFSEDVLVVDVQPEHAFRERLLDPRARQEGSDTCYAACHEPIEIRLADLPVAQRPPPPESDASPPATRMALHEEVYAALTLGTQDYARKNGFSDAVVALSGGIDSALTAAIAVDALGADHVLGVAMPTRYSSSISLADAEELANNLGFQMLTIPIDDVFQAYLDALASVLADHPPDVTEENIQPRIRGNVIMALSNKLGHLVLTTGNKSEVGVGYTTLYGDTAGGFAPLKDVPKTFVYELARWRNDRAAKPWIPKRSITRPPTAELKEDQVDQDVLPPYEVLDPILQAYVEEERSVGEIVSLGYERDLVLSVVRMVDRAEYKRRQSPPGVKITERAFGRDRRMPITKRSYHDGS